MGGLEVRGGRVRWWWWWWGLGGGEGLPSEANDVATEEGVYKISAKVGETISAKWCHGARKTKRLRLQQFPW